MGKIKEPSPVKVFCGLIYKEEEIFLKVQKKLEKRWGEIDLTAGPFPFDFTDYYEKEMGKNLKRRFISFKRIIVPENFWAWKIYTNCIEETFSKEGKREINIDPGYVDFSKVVLLSTKDFYHRIYIGKGIYAEVTMYYSKGQYHFFQWTYPDYRTEFYLQFFTEMRKIYSQQLKNKKNEDVD